MMGFYRKSLRIAIGLLVLNLVFAGIYLVFSGKVTENKNQILNLKEDLNIQLTRESQFNSLKDIVLETEEEREKLDSFFVLEEEVAPFISLIESTANLSGVSIKIQSVGINPYYTDVAKIIESNNLELLSINIISSGNWSNNFYFLNLLEELPYKVFIKRFNLDKDSDGNVITNKWEGFFEIEVFKKK